MPSNTVWRPENGLSPTIVNLTGNHTLTPDDNGSVLVVTSGTGKTVTTDSAQLYPVGFWCIVIQGGAGQITFGTTGTTHHNRQTHTKTAGQYAEVTIRQKAADVFNLSGDTGA